MWLQCSYGNSLVRSTWILVVGHSPPPIRGLPLILFKCILSICILYMYVLQSCMYRSKYDARCYIWVLHWPPPISDSISIIRTGQDKNKNIIIMNFWQNEIYNDIFNDITSDIIYIIFGWYLFVKGIFWGYPQGF